MKVIYKDKEYECETGARISEILKKEIRFSRKEIY